MPTLSYPKQKSVDNLKVKLVAELTAGKRRQLAQGLSLSMKRPAKADKPFDKNRMT